MAKLNGWLSGAQGKLDGKTIYQEGGNTYIRQIVTPKNPKTLAQNVQRVITKTSNQQYKAFKALCDHSFEGKTYGKECMARFLQLNNIRFRERAIELQESGADLGAYYNFAPKGSSQFVPARVYLSEGTLNQVRARIEESGGYQKANIALTENTYAKLLSTYGLKRGDQLTFVTVEWDGYEFRPAYARVILDPRDSNGEPLPLSTPFVDVEELAINAPNPRNSGAFNDVVFENNRVVFSIVASLDCACAGVIVSRKVDSNWLRSTCLLTMSEAALTAHPTFKCSLIEAASNENKSLYFDDGYYLNAGGESGASGSGSVVPQNPAAPTITSITIDDTTQDASGGSIEVNTRPSSIIIDGFNLEDSDDEVLSLFLKEDAESGEVDLIQEFADPNSATTRSIAEVDTTQPWEQYVIGYQDAGGQLVGSPLFVINYVAPIIINP